MDLQPKDPEAATEGKGYFIGNRRTLEFLLIAGFLGLAIPVTVLLGVQSGTRTAALAYPNGAPAPVASVEAATATETNYSALVKGSKAAEEKGQALYTTNCSACHGLTGGGDGPAAVAFKPPPRNFADPAAKWTFSRELPAMFKSISNGSPGTGMVGFAGTLSLEDRWAIVHYLATLPGVKGQYAPIDEALATSWRPE